MLLTQDGALSIGYDEQFSRVSSEITDGELFASDKHVEEETFIKTAFKALGTKPNESHYSRDFSKLFAIVMKLDIGKVQRGIQASLISTITLNSEATKAINKQIKPDMSQFWKADQSPAFFEVITSKPLLISILESLTDKKTAAEHTRSKVKVIRALMKIKACEQAGWTPNYLSGCYYGSGQGAPLN